MGKSLVSYFLTHGVNTLGFDADIITLAYTDDAR